jgi:hypothetical protein
MPNIQVSTLDRLTSHVSQRRNTVMN